ncbi:MAG: hypothetical protein HY791_05780 [Deltaproteobacteria bacterium]|nr:hypothetical protein [Deltaproteobacteria bacterium]
MSSVEDSLAAALAEGFTQLSEAPEAQLPHRAAIWARALSSPMTSLGEARVSRAGELVAVNGVSVQPGPARDELSALLARLQLDELRLLRTPDSGDLILLSRTDRAARRLGRQLDAPDLPVRSCRTIPTLGQAERAARTSSLLRAFADVIVIHGLLLERVSSGRPAFLRPLRRAIHQLIRLAAGLPAELAMLSASVLTPGPSAAPSIATVVVMALAERLCAPRDLTAELALAALTVDLSARPDVGTPAQRIDESETHLVRSLTAVAGEAGDPRAVRRAALGYEALMPTAGKDGIVPTVAGRALGIAATFADLVAPRPPTRGLSSARALDILLASHDDPRMARLLATTLGRPPLGSVVRLSSGDVAVVVPPLAAPGSAPRVRLLTSRGPGPTLELASDGRRQIVGLDDPRDLGLNPLCVVFNRAEGGQS